jgi:hypothetical protein
MIPPIDTGYSKDRSSDPPHASDYFDRYLEATQSSYSSLDSVGSQSEGSSFAAGSDPEWFKDFILYESDDSDFQANPTSVSQTSGSVRMDASSDMATIPLFAPSPRSVPVSTDTAVPNEPGFYRQPYPTELDEADYAVVFNYNMPNFQWNLTEPALNLSASSHSESKPGKGSEQSSLEHSMLAQNDAAGRLPVPRMRYFKCSTCQSHYSSESRLRSVLPNLLLSFPANLSSTHLRNFHAPPRFTCGTCNYEFKQKKDLRRHQLTHEPSKPPFACSCTKTYARYDGLLRHFTEMATRPREAGRHKAVDSNPK